MILAVNTGSSSKKYALFEGENEAFSAHFEKTKEGIIAGFLSNGAREEKNISEADYKDGVGFFIESAVEKGVIANSGDIARVGVRIVAPGEYFYSHSLINDAYIKKLEEAKEEAPLHIGPIVSEIEEIREALPEIEIVAVSDSFFHRTIPAAARDYAIPKEAREEYGIHRFGFHGISVSSVARSAEELCGELPERMIVCHLGSGASITAVKDGASLDTSMGFTPLEGLIMGTRVGDIDPGALIYLGERSGLGYRELEEYLNNKCGLLGASGISGDMKELLDLERNGGADAKEAIEMFVYRIKKYIGAYAAALGGIDLLVFTATIGERSSILRERIVSGLGFLGLELDHSSNSEVSEEPRFISAGSEKIAVIPAMELREIALTAQRA